MKLSKTRTTLAAAAAVLAAGCATDTSVHKVGPHSYLVCDKGSDGVCNGANPEKGINKTCPAEHRSIVGIRDSKLVGQGIIVTCGPKVKR